MDDKLTSISFSSDGQDILINMNEGRVLALDADTGEVRMRYEGVVQHLFVIRSCFGGAGENFVMSGSEDSRVYVWRRQTGVQVAVLEHGPGTVNAVAWHPRKWGVFASAGDDRRVRM
jgi:WD repeat-containing protein 26